MRPRVFPAENDEHADIRAGVQRASMRPRVFPAENIAVIEGILDDAELQ